MRASRTVCLVAGVMAVLSGCTQAPSDDALKADLQSVIDAGLAPGLVDVETATRAGLLTFVWGDQAQVRFDASLRLKRDHRFGSWDQINAGALSLMLDAAPEHILGVKPTGNVAGDILTVRGGLPYRDAGGDLQLDTAPPEPPREPPPESARGFVLVAEFKAAVRARWRQFKGEAQASQLGISLDEWSRSRRAAAGLSARQSGGYAIATDSIGSDTWLLGAAAAHGAREQGIAFANVDTQGTREALDLVRDGRVTAAVVRNTEAVLAASGLPPFDTSGPYRLSALATLYPQPVHVVVKEDSALGSPSEFFGKHVGVAGLARANAVEAEAILRSHGVPLASLAAPLIPVPQAEALDQLAAGVFDALIMTSALPNANLRAFASRRPVRLLPFDSDAIALLTSGIAHYVAITVPARTYPGQTRPLAAVAAVTMLVSMDTVPEKEAAGLIELMLTRIDYLRGGSLAGALVMKEEAERSMTLPWHPGAERFFETPKG